MAHGVADLPNRHAVAAHDRHGGVTALVGMSALHLIFTVSAACLHVGHVCLRSVQAQSGRPRGKDKPTRINGCLKRLRAVTEA